MERVISKRAVAESSDAVASSANNLSVLLRQASGMEMRCRSPPERRLPFSPRTVSAPRAARGFQPGAADGKRCFSSEKITEHGDVYQDGAVTQEKYVLLYGGNSYTGNPGLKGSSLPSYRICP